MKKLAGIIVSAIAVIAMAVGCTACSEAALPDPDAYSFVTIDINPSVEMIALGDGVIEVKAANYDACVLLDGEDFSCMTVEEAATHIVSLAEEMGYLTDTNNQVKISVISDDAQTAELLKSAAKSGAQKGSKKAVAVAETRLQDELTVKKLKEEKPDKFADMSEEKVRLIESVMEYDSSMTYELGAEMTVKELSALLKSAINENKDIFTAELRDGFSARYAAAKREIERSIAQVYGEDYLAAWEKYAALENVYDGIVNRLRKSGLSEEDTVAVTELLGISDASLIEKGGVVKPEYVLGYIDKHIGKKPAQAEQIAVEEVQAILDKYDQNDYVLSEEEIAEISEVLGKDVEFTLLSELEDKVAEYEAEAAAIKSTLRLTDEQVALIRELKESFSSIKETVLEGMRDEIAAAREEIAAAKQERENRG